MSLSPVHETPKTRLFDINTGEISETFLRQMNLAGIQGEKILKKYGPYHLLNVNKLLSENGCFQVDAQFYDKGGVSSFKLTQEQAEAFLDDDYSGRSMEMPEEKNIDYAFFPTGVTPTMHKRFNSLKESLEQGYQFKHLYFIVRTQADQEAIQTLIESDYKELLAEMDIRYVVTDVEMDVLRVGLTSLAPTLPQDASYAMIGDPTFVDKFKMIAASVLEAQRPVGAASAPIKDWRKEMSLFDYTAKKFGSLEQATVLWAKSAWNFKAREVYEEAQFYHKTHPIS